MAYAALQQQGLLQRCIGWRWRTGLGGAGAQTGAVKQAGAGACVAAAIWAGFGTQPERGGE